MRMKLTAAILRATRLQFSFDLLVRMLEKQIAEIDCDSNTFLGEQCTKVLIYRKLGAKTDGVVAIDSKC